MAGPRYRSMQSREAPSERLNLYTVGDFLEEMAAYEALTNQHLLPVSASCDEALKREMRALAAISSAP